MQAEQSPNERYQLFQYDSCPFCFRVRRFLQQAGISIPVRDVLRDREAYEELVAGGGRQTVPCLRIERTADDGSVQVQWMYESADIMAYLADRFSLRGSA